MYIAYYLSYMRRSTLSPFGPPGLLQFVRRARGHAAALQKSSWLGAALQLSPQERTPGILFESYQSIGFIWTKSNLNNFYFQFNVGINKKKKIHLKSPTYCEENMSSCICKFLITLEIPFLVGINTRLFMASLLVGVALLTIFFGTWLPKPFPSTDTASTAQRNFTDTFLCISVKLWLIFFFFLMRTECNYKCSVIYPFFSWKINF